MWELEPELGISEDSQTTFSPELVKAGRLTDLAAMDKLVVGLPIVESTAKEMSQERGIKIINSRWVLTANTIGGQSNQCRARCVVQEVAAGSQSAQNLGLSSATPSIEAFRAFVAAVQYFDMWLKSFGISTASFLRGCEGYHSTACRHLLCSRFVPASLLRPVSSNERIESSFQSMVGYAFNDSEGQRWSHHMPQRVDHHGRCDKTERLPHSCISVRR